MRRCQHVDVLAGPRRLRPAFGRTDRPFPSALAPIAAGSAPGTARIEPSNASSPTAAKRSTASGAIAPMATINASTMARSKWLPSLGKSRRREVDGHVLIGKAEPHGVQRIAHALAAFGDGFVGQPDDHERRRTGRDAHLHLDRARLDAHERQRGDGAVYPRPFTQLPAVGNECAAGFRRWLFQRAFSRRAAEVIRN